GHAGAGERPAQARFVLVSGGGGDQPVADPQPLRGRGLRRVVGHLPDAETELWDEIAVVQLHGGNGRSSHGSHGSNHGLLRAETPRSTAATEPLRACGTLARYLGPPSEHLG